MFLIDKYYYDSNFLLCYKTLIEKILKSFDRHKIIYDNVKVKINRGGTLFPLFL